MQPNEVLAILNKTVKLSREMTESLQRKRDVYYGISLHTTGACPAFRDLSGGGTIYPQGYYGPEYQRLFDKHLLSRHPRENDATRNWRFSQYRPLTKAPFAQITEIITGAIFQDSNYDLNLQDTQDEQYIWGNHFGGHDIVGYFCNVAFRNMVEDPNGILLRIPALPGYAQADDKLQVDIWFVNTKDIVLLTQDDFVFLRNGYAWWVDKQTIWRFSYKPEEKKYYLSQEDAHGYYAHMLGRLPISIAGGVWNTQGYYDSYYSKAKAAADDFVSAYSAAQLVDKEASHPFIVEASTDCPDCRGLGQVQQDCDSCPNGVELVSCGSCHGSGQISRNPGQHIIVPQDKLKDGSPIQIVNPDVSINSHHRGVCAQVMNLIIEALHLQKTEEAQSGVAKAIDQERLYKFISNVSNHVFDKLITDTLRDIIAYRNAGAIAGTVHPVEYPFRVLKPTQFRIKTSADLLNEYATGKQAGMPVFIRRRMALDFVDKQYSGDALMKKKAQLITQLDSLSILSIDEITAMRNAGVVSDVELQYSRKLPAAIDALIRDKGEYWFLNTPNDVVELGLFQV
ncbi:MAG TPA: hypothetical protein VK167_11720 [Flavipsychrobacter sp.]|nr:hypothetical protein [Flavipsychrobacter sp.]